MKKNIVVSGSLEDMVIYCTAVYEVNKEVDIKGLEVIIDSSPIFEDKNFYTSVLGNLQKTTVTRKSKIFVKDNKITFQLRYEMLQVVDIDLTKNDEKWVKNDIKHLLEHFEILISEEE